MKQSHSAMRSLEGINSRTDVLLQSGKRKAYIFHRKTFSVDYVKILTTKKSSHSFIDCGFSFSSNCAELLNGR